MWVWKPEGNLKAGQAHTAKETNTMVKEEWTEKGYIDEPADNGTDLAAEIRRMCKEKDAIILAHYYTDGSVQKVATSLATRWPWRARLPRPTPRLS